MECLLEGVIESKHEHALEQLVRGITGARPRALYSHEHIFQNDPRIIGAGPCELRLSCSLDAPPDTAWTVVHEGGAMRGTEAAKLGCQIRSVLRCHASSAVPRLVGAMGMGLKSEFLRRGTCFTLRHRGSVITLNIVSLLLPVPDPDAVPDNAVAIGDPSAPLHFAPPSASEALHLCDLSAPAAADNYATVSSTLLNFAEMLAPLITFSKPGTSAGIPPTAAAAAAAIAPP